MSVEPEAGGKEGSVNGEAADEGAEDGEGDAPGFGVGIEADAVFPGHFSDPFPAGAAGFHVIVELVENLFFGGFGEVAAEHPGESGEGDGEKFSGQIPPDLFFGRD